MSATDPTYALAAGRRQMRAQRAMPAIGGTGWAPNPYEDESGPTDVQVENHAEFVIRPDASLTDEIVISAASDSEFIGRVYDLINRDINRESDAWCAARLHELIEGLKSASEQMALEDV